MNARDTHVEISEADGSRRDANDNDELEQGLKQVFGDSAFATRVEEDGDRVVVDGESWKFVARRSGRLVFKPGGAAYRLVRRTEDLEAVESDGDNVSFVFDDEEIVLGRGVGHRG